MKKLNKNLNKLEIGKNKILIGLVLILIIGIVSADQANNIIWQIGKHDKNHAEFDPNPKGATHYYVGTSPINFPKDLNDGFNERTQVYIHYDLTDKQAEKDMELMLCITELNSPEKSFKFRIKVNDKSTGYYYFTSPNSCETIDIDKKFNRVGENVILIENTHPPFTNHWILWDYLELKIKECPYECCVGDEYYDKPCGSSEECKEHYCKVVKNLGDSCSSNSECKSDYCIGDICMQPPTPPQFNSKAMDASSDNPGALVVQITNIINNPDIEGQIILDVPDNIEVHNIIGGHAGKAAYSVTYDAPAGEAKYIEIQFDSKTAGDYRFSATLYWHWKGDAEVHQLGLDKTITVWPVKECSGKYCAPNEECIENKCSEKPKIDSNLILLVAVIFLGLVAIIAVWKMREKIKIKITEITKDSNKE